MKPKDKYKILTDKQGEAKIVNSNNYSTTYIAYDKEKKENCFLTLPNVDTSWIYSVEY